MCFWLFFLHLQNVLAFGTTNWSWLWRDINGQNKANNGPPVKKSLSIQICRKKGINPTILLWGWDWDHQTCSREGYGSLGNNHFPTVAGFMKKAPNNSEPISQFLLFSFWPNTHLHSMSRSSRFYLCDLCFKVADLPLETFLKWIWKNQLPCSVATVQPLVGAQHSEWPVVKTNTQLPMLSVSHNLNLVGGFNPFETY